MASHEARLETLESRLAFQEDTIQQLNDALVGQQTRIDRLEALLMLMAQRFGSEAAAPGPVDEPPPHY